MAKKRRKLGEILFKAGILKKGPLIDAIKVGKNENKKLGQVLIERGLIDEDTLTKALAKQYGMKYINLGKHPPPPEAMSLISMDLIRENKVVPLGKENGRLQVAITDPEDLETLDNLRFRLNAELDFSLASPKRVDEFLEESAGADIQTTEEEEKLQEERERLRHSIDATASELAESGHDIRAEALRAEAAGATDDGPIVRLANLIIDNAYHMRASDIHIEPMADRVRIRYRVDGVCLEKDNIPKNMQAQLVTRFKILSGMDIAEKRLPQDGRIKRTIDNQDIDFRVSSLPGYHGPSVVLRILRPDAVNIGIEALGFEPEDNQRFQKIIKRPNGIFLVTGPTGSGKTTTLYGALQTLNTPNRKIITAEDPVEYNFAGMNQCQVRSEIGLSFSNILRSMLRQAPNVILVGEIRDGEVADIAIQAALTGHLVFSTLHTNDAPSAITRLIDMGVKPFLAASSVQAIMAQRLIRLICDNCKEEDKNPDPHDLRVLDITPDDLEGKTLYKGRGCSRCEGTGFKGRSGIFEMFELNSEVRELAFAKAPTSEIRKAAIAGGMKTLMEDGKIKVFRGKTAAGEVAKVAQKEGVLLD